MKIDISIPDFQSDERGVSPVIGVILMVAITVILAAVIGAFVLDLGSQLGSTGPQTQLTIADNPGDDLEGTAEADDLVDIEHKGGDDLKPSDLKVIVTQSGTDRSSSVSVTWGDGTGDFTVGEVATITESTSFVDTDTTLTVKVIHKPSNSVVASSTVEVK